MDTCIHKLFAPEVCEGEHTDIDNMIRISTQHQKHIQQYANTRICIISDLQHGWWTTMGNGTDPDPAGSHSGMLIPIPAKLTYC